MNKNFFSSIFFAISFSILAGNCQSNTQTTKQKSEIPSIEVLLPDSASIFQTTTLSQKKPVVLLFFNTTCDHCQQEALDLVMHKTELRKIQLVMMSSENLNLIRKFYDQYELSSINKLIIGKDIRNSGMKHFQYESLPFCAIYTREHLFISSLERDFKTVKIIQLLKAKGEL
jgi:thiol-disulfide isomerase/thioredoxin